MSARNATSAALDRAQLRRSFSAVPIGLKVLGGPINSGSPAIFQMSIQRSRRFGEYVQIWPGGRDNEIEILSSESSLLQAVLRVKEPRRRFVEIVRKTGWTRAEAVTAHALAGGGRILKETRYDWRLEMWTPSVDRRYLLGRDDLHLFVAQVREGASVFEAHESLKPDEVRRAEASSPAAVVRQGEWFFLPLSDEESDRLRRALAERPRALKLRAPVGDGGRPHVADAVVSVDWRVRTPHREHRRREVYARGAVAHPDHRPLWLEEWRRVVRNREVRSAGESLRIPWID